MSALALGWTHTPFGKQVDRRSFKIVTMKVFFTTIFMAGIVTLDYCIGGLEGLGLLDFLPDQSEALIMDVSPLMHAWKLLLVLPFLPICWALSAYPWLPKPSQPC